MRHFPAILDLTGRVVFLPGGERRRRWRRDCWRAGAVLLDGASLLLPAGEMLGLIGPNGAGKLTLLRLLEELTPPDAGGVMRLGRPMEDWTVWERAGRMGYLPQHFAPHWAWRVSEMLRPGLSTPTGRSPSLPGGAF
jgi:ABC-type multidrug transport system ATPase subunit